MYDPANSSGSVWLISAQRFTPQFLLMRLKHATTAQDEASETIASSFVHGLSSDPATNGKDVDDFVKEFREMRKVYHKRVIWVDRWSAGQIASTMTCKFFARTSDSFTDPAHLRLSLELFRNTMGVHSSHSMLNIVIALLFIRACDTALTAPTER